MPGRSRQRNCGCSCRRWWQQPLPHCCRVGGRRRPTSPPRSRAAPNYRDLKDVRMKTIVLEFVFLLAMPALAIAADAPATKTPAKPARTAVDPAKEAEHEKEDIKRHRTIAAA